MEQIAKEYLKKINEYHLMCARHDAEGAKVIKKELDDMVNQMGGESVAMPIINSVSDMMVERYRAEKELERFDRINQLLDESIARVGIDALMAEECFNFLSREVQELLALKRKEQDK